MSIKLDTKICRVCLSSSGSIAIFDGYGKDDQFRFCTQLEATEGDGLPTNLCRKCNDHLKISYDFRFQAIYAEKYFRKTIFLPSLKKETENDGRDDDVDSDDESNGELDENMAEIDKLLAVQHDDDDNGNEFFSQDNDHHSQSQNEMPPPHNTGKIENVFKHEVDVKIQETEFFNVPVNTGPVQQEAPTTSQLGSIPYTQQSSYPMTQTNASQPQHYTHFNSNPQFSYQMQSHQIPGPSQQQVYPPPANYDFQQYQQPYAPPFVPPVPAAAPPITPATLLPSATEVLDVLNKEPTLNLVSNVAGTPDLQSHLSKPEKSEKRQAKKEKIECNICGTNFTHVNSLRNHMLIHSGQKPFKCEFCSKAFARKTVLNIHRRLHTGERPYKCKHCENGYVTKEALMRHISKDHESESNLRKVKVSFICSICNKSRCSKYSLASHMKTHLRDNDGRKRGPNKKKRTKPDDASGDGKKSVPAKYTCRICQEPFQNKWDFTKHTATHETPNRSFECDICASVFEKKYQLLYHLQTHEGGEEMIKEKMRSTMNAKLAKEAVSKETPVTVGSESDESNDDIPLNKLRQKRDESEEVENEIKQEDDEEESEAEGEEGEHLQESAPSEDEKMEKDDASEPIKQKTRRRENLKAMRRQNKIECHICEAKFTHPCSLKTHMLVHSGERPHKCDHCDKTFARKTVLNIHRRLHTGERPYSCPLCPVTTVTKDALMRHMSKDHDDERELDKLKYTCGICQKGMGSKYSLQAHMKLHEQKNPGVDNVQYKCSKCNETFDSKDNYTNHLETHTQDVTRNFQCDICQATFEKKFKLLLHIQSHTIEQIECKKCGEKFSIRENLIQHVKTHIDPKNLDFQCPQCDAGVYDTRDLKLHMLETHTISMGEINACDLCSLNYDTAAEYYRHMNEKHDSISKSCHECDKYFESRKLFDKHMMSHYM